MNGSRCSGVSRRTRGWAAAPARGASSCSHSIWTTGSAQRGAVEPVSKARHGSPRRATPCLLPPGTERCWLRVALRTLGQVCVPLIRARAQFEAQSAGPSPRHPRSPRPLSPTPSLSILSVHSLFTLCTAGSSARSASRASARQSAASGGTVLGRSWATPQLATLRPPVPAGVDCPGSWRRNARGASC